MLPCLGAGSSCVSVLLMMFLLACLDGASSVVSALLAMLLLACLDGTAGGARATRVCSASLSCARTLTGCSTIVPRLGYVSTPPVFVCGFDDSAEAGERRLGAFPLSASGANTCSAEEGARDRREL